MEWLEARRNQGREIIRATPQLPMDRECLERNIKDLIGLCEALKPYRGIGYAIAAGTMWKSRVLVHHGELPPPQPSLLYLFYFILLFYFHHLCITLLVSSDLL
jgi:hypothetical protein